MTLPRTVKTLKPGRPPAPAEAAGPRADALYSIRVTSRLTAIELDTLRVWERRYGFPRPQRDSVGSRLYSGAEIEVLKLLRRALALGYRPGEVVGKPLEELMLLIAVASEQPAREEAPRVGSRPPPAASAGVSEASASIDALLASLLSDDLAALRAGLRQAALTLGPRGFLVTIVHPLSVRVGALWAERKIEVRHEHVLSDCVSTQLRAMMSAYEDHPASPRVLLTTLPGERHGLGLEMTSVYLAVQQVTPILLGVETPAEQIVEAARRHEVDAVGLLVTQASDIPASASQIRWVRSALPREIVLWIGGAGGPDLDLSRDDALIVREWRDLDRAITSLSRKS